MWPLIIQTRQDLERLLEERCFLFPVLVDPNEHYIENAISFLYGFTIQSRKEFLVGVNHYDIPSIGCGIHEIRTNVGHLCYKKKYLPWYSLMEDVEMKYWLNTGLPLKIQYNTAIEFFHKKGLKNSIVPIYKWVEVIRSIRDEIIETQDPPVIVSRAYNNFLNQLIKIEHAGLFVNTILDNSGSGRCATGYLVHTEYNPYTITGRPSNSFGGINYAALPKHDGSREKYVSRFENGFLIEFDYQAFHVNLIAKLLGYKFPDEPYTYLAKMFFGVDAPSREQIHESKNLTFQQIYGGVNSKFKHIPFFEMLDEYLSRVRKLNSNGEMKSVLFKNPMPSTDNHIKTFNYLLQNFETEINSLVITKIHKLLEHKNSKLVLYTYDSFLFDYDRNDGKELLLELKKTIESIGVKTRVKIGKNYHHMVEKK